MKDIEIIKALECCTSWVCATSCADCPLKDTECLHFNKLGETLNLITRQKAEIERFKEHCSKCGEKTTKTILNLQELLGTARAEAIKEFAERLKNKLTACSKTIDGKCEYLICDSEIDNLVKEMVGDV